MGRQAELWRRKEGSTVTRGEEMRRRRPAHWTRTRRWEGRRRVKKIHRQQKWKRGQRTTDAPPRQM